MKKLSILFLGLFVLASCSKDDDNGTETDKETEKSDAKEITSFTFLASDNDELTEDLVAIIKEEGKTIIAEFPFGTDISSLVPTITVSESAMVDPEDKKATDFTDEVIYTVTAEDGSKVEFTVIVSVTSIAEREVLIALYNANPENTLDWNLNDKDISNWSGVTVESGKVTELELDNVSVVNIPAEIEFLTNLTSFVYIDREVLILPPEIGRLKNLKKLTVYNVAEIIQLPVEIYNITSLEEIIIRPTVFVGDSTPTGLMELPMEIGKLTNLKTLDLWGNSLESLPAEIGGLRNLEKLDLTNNSLESLPAEIGDLTNLQVLSLSSNDTLESLPAEIKGLLNLEELYVGVNSLTSLPKEIGSLTKLRRFAVFNNSLTQIPEEIGNLENLEFLNISDNPLENDQPEIYNLENLEYLLMSDISLINIPSGIGNLTSLKGLYLNKNKLASIPTDLGNLSNLEILDLRDNQIISVPKAICDLDIEDFRKDDTAICEE